MIPVLYGVGTVLVFLLIGCFLVGYLSEIVFVGALLAGLLTWGVAEIKETVYYYYRQTKELLEEQKSKE